KLLTCQTYTDKEDIRQQQLLAFIPRHHKHYILPNFVSKKVHFSPQLQTDPRKNYLHAKSRLQPSGIVFLSRSKKHLSNSLGLSSQNSESSDTQELDLEFRLSL
ncbi:hypothetical protein Gotur_010913, partial [Gossypium turneri]